MAIFLSAFVDSKGGNDGAILTKYQYNFNTILTITSFIGFRFPFREFKRVHASDYLRIEKNGTI